MSATTQRPAGCNGVKSLGQVGYWPFPRPKTLGEDPFGYAPCLTYVEVEGLSHIWQ